MQIMKREIMYTLDSQKIKMCFNTCADKLSYWELAINIYNVVGTPNTPYILCCNQS